MKEVFAYVIGLGAAVMMPAIFTVLGVLIGIRFSKALKSGLLVGVGFVGLGVVTALLTSSLGPALKGMTELYHLNLPYFDLGWPAAAAVAYSCAVGAFIIPVCLGVNVLMLVAGCTRTVLEQDVYTALYGFGAGLPVTDEDGRYTRRPASKPS